MIRTKRVTSHRRLADKARVALLALGVALCCGCLGSVQCPERGGRPWRELRSPHFIVRTDVELEAARQLVADFEAQLGLFTGVLFRIAAAFDEPTEIVLFDSDYELAPSIRRCSTARRGCFRLTCSSASP